MTSFVDLHLVLVVESFAANVARERERLGVDEAVHLELVQNLELFTTSCAREIFFVQIRHVDAGSLSPIATTANWSRSKLGI